MDHQTSVAPSKAMPSLNHMSHKPRPRPAPIPDSGSMEWTSEDSQTLVMTSKGRGKQGKEGEGDTQGAQEGLVGSDHNSPPTPAEDANGGHLGAPRESSTDASGEDIPSLSDMRASGGSMDSGGPGSIEDGDGPLRIWAPMNLTLSRDESCPGAHPTGGSSTGGGYSSPTKSAESDTDLNSPVGFWQENFETIDARNANRRFSLWGDSGSGEEASPDGGSSGSLKGQDGQGWDDDASTGGKLDHTPGRSAADSRPADPDASSLGVTVGRKLFASPEGGVKGMNGPTKSCLDTMAEGHESSSPVVASGNGTHPIAFWATAVETDGDVGLPVENDCIDRSKGGHNRSGGEEKETGARRWRRGEAGLVVPEVRPPSRRSVTIQQVVPQRGRVGDTPVAAEIKGPLGGPRPATSSPTLPAAGEHKPKANTNLHTLSHGVKITRSYSYHGLGSMALYDSANRG